MKTNCKIVLTAALAAALSPAAAWAQNQPLTCWYNGHADFTSASPAAADAVMGRVAKAESGDKTFSYTISARDGTACPVQLPLSTETAMTVALVRQDDGTCANETVSDAAPATLGGSVTVSRESEYAISAGIKLAGVSPNTNYRIFLKCGRQLGTLRTDGSGNGGRTVDVPAGALGPAYAFEIYPEEAAPGSKLQSLTLKK